MNDNVKSDSTPSRSFGDDSVGYDPTTETFHGRFDSGLATIAVATVKTVATARNCDSTAMQPLFETIDPEALADLVASTRETAVDVTFSYEDCRVTVSSDGSVTVEPPRD